MDDHAPENLSEEIRYRGKAVDDDEWIAGFLAEQRSGVLGLVDGDGPHLVTQLFVYDEDAGAVFLHGAQAGRAPGVVAGGDAPRAAFTTSETGRFVPADEPVNFTVEYASVVAYGTVDLVEDAAEKRRVLERFMAKFAPHLEADEDYVEIREASVDRTAVYRLDVTSWSGKRGEKPPDHPGAYDLDAVEGSD